MLLSECKNFKNKTHKYNSCLHIRIRFTANISHSLSIFDAENALAPVFILIYIGIALSLHNILWANNLAFVLISRPKDSIIGPFLPEQDKSL